MKNILVTGASGIIGSALINHLIREDPEALIDATYYKNISLLCRDTSNAAGRIKIYPYKDCLSSEKIYDQIWHFATYGQPARFIEDWQPIIKLNTSDIIALSNKVSPQGRFMYASTSELYGDSENCTEETIPSSYTCTPRSIYTDSKKLGESILSCALPHDQYRIFRICLAYSPYYRIGDRRVLYELISKALLDDVINLLDDGSAERQYIHADDACTMMYNLASMPYECLKLNGKAPIFNISNPDSISIYRLALMIGEILNVRVQKGFSSLNNLDALKRVSIIPERYSCLYPQTNFIDLRSGIEQVCSHSKQHFKCSSDIQTK